MKDIPLPTAEQARRVRDEPHTPLVEIFGPTPPELATDPVTEVDQLQEQVIRLLREMPYRAYLTTSHWQETRRKALERARHACQVCSRRDDLQVHHRTYDRRGCELPDDLIVLCDGCHETFHAAGRLAA